MKKRKRGGPKKFKAGKRRVVARGRKAVVARPRKSVRAHSRSGRLVVQDVAGTTTVGGRGGEPIFPPPEPRPLFSAMSADVPPAAPPEPLAPPSPKMHP